MNTPIYDFIRQYASADAARFHMPGHKGVTYLGPEAFDITEIRGADELYFPEGIIAESERNAASLFGTGLTHYSTEGSSHVIRTMILLARQCFSTDDTSGKRPFLLAARNAHKALLYACAVTDTDVRWMYPPQDAENSVASCQIDPPILRDALTRCRAEGQLPFSVYVTSPDYLGDLADIRALSAVCRDFDVPLLVDNAHGAYLHFLEEPLHPMDLGAAMCSDSAHKTLPVLTPGAYLHVSEELVSKGIVTPEAAKAASEVTGTTSPSYLTMASLDLCNRYLSDAYPPLLASAVDMIASYKTALTESGIPLVKSEPLKLVIDAAALGLSGDALGRILEENGMVPEFCDAAYLVLMLTPDTRPADLNRLKAVLAEVKSRALPRVTAPRLTLRPLERAMTIREAVFASHETVCLEDAAGRILGAPAVSCPPAVPIAVSGEVLDPAVLEVFRTYGIDRVSVIHK